MSEKMTADQLQDEAWESSTQLERGKTALEEILETFEYEENYEPDAHKLHEFVSSVDRKDKQANNSWEFISSYKKIIWLVRVALDYSYNALEKLSRINEAETKNSYRLSKEDNENKNMLKEMIDNENDSRKLSLIFKYCSALING